MRIEKTNGKQRVRMPDIITGDNSEDLAAPISHIYDLTIDAHRICDLMDPDFESDCKYSHVLQKALNMLCLSPTAKAMVEEAVQHKWRLCFRHLDSAEFSIDIEKKVIAIDHEGLSGDTLITSEYFFNSALVTLSRALRDIWHEKRQDPFEKLFRAEAVLMLERIRSADCDVISILVAWELRSEGFNHIWRFMIGSDCGDMAMIFANHLERDPSSHFTHKALRSTFEQWYRCEDRVSGCDHQTLNYMDEVLNNLDDESFGQKMPTHICIELLSCLPDKTAYLQNMGKAVLHDPLYAGLHDPINQAHFLHILHDVEATIVENVAFRDSELADKIFPYDNSDQSERTEHIDS